MSLIHTNVKLGKLAPRHDPRNLQIGKYLIKKALPPPPSLSSYAQLVPSWPMMGNDVLGDCTCATVGHQIQQWTRYAGNMVVLPDSTIVGLYSSVGGYVPGNPNTDNGAVIQDVLNYCRQNGVGGHKFMAYASVNPALIDEVKTCVNLFGNVSIGLALPITAQSQSVWSAVPNNGSGNNQPGSWGGHSVPIVQYDDNGPSVITWGQYLHMTWKFFTQYCDEAWAVLSQDWVDKKLGKSPEGLDLSQLQSDLGLVTA